MIGAFSLNDACKLLGVEHIENIVAMSHLHSGCAGIFIAGYHFHAVALQFDCHFFAKFAASEQQGFASHGGLNRADFCHLISR